MKANKIGILFPKLFWPAVRKKWLHSTVLIFFKYLDIMYIHNQDKVHVFYKRHKNQTKSSSFFYFSNQTSKKVEDLSNFCGLLRKYVWTLSKIKKVIGIYIVINDILLSFSILQSWTMNRERIFTCNEFIR